MDDIYVIIRGEYSDWSIQGYTTKEDEAKRMCAILRSKEKSKYADKFYYQKVKHFLTPDEMRNKIIYLYDIRFEKTENGGYAIHRDEWYGEYEYYLETDEKAQYKHKFDEEIGVDVDGRIYVGVKLHENNLAKAEKIAQDRLYKYIAEQNGIG